MSGSYRDLRVWQLAMALAEAIYAATNDFPAHEVYGLRSQMRRASIPSNIAEGKGHHSNPEFLRFLYHARGSLCELETQTEMAARLGYLKAEMANRLLAEAAAVGGALAGLINSLRAEAVGVS